MQSTQGGIEVRIRGRELCVNPLQWLRMSWNLFKKWQSNVAPTQMFLTAFLCPWHHPPGDRDRETETKCYVTDPGSTLRPDSNGGWLPSPLLDPSPCLCWKQVCKSQANGCSSARLGWWSHYITVWHGLWKFTLGGCNMFAARFIATCDKGDDQSPFQKVGCSYLLTKHSAVKLAQPRAPYKYQVPFLPSSSENLHPPSIFQTLCRSTQSTTDPQPWGSSTCSSLLSSSSSRLLQVRSKVDPTKNKRACKQKCVHRWKKASVNCQAKSDGVGMVLCSGWDQEHLCSWWQSS